MTKIAVILPEPYRGGTLRVLRHLALMLKVGAGNKGVKLEVVVGVREDCYDIDREFSQLREHNVSIREIFLKGVPRKEAVRIIAAKSPEAVTAITHDYYFLPSDRCNDFLDCDLWLIETDRCPFPLLPVRPYAVHVPDYIQRYCPWAFPDDHWELQTRGFIPTVRAAEFIITTTPAVTSDLNSYAGVCREKIRQVPVFIECDLKPGSVPPLKQDYFVWSTNTSGHKNHGRVLDALEQYYEELNGKLKAYMVGPLTHAFRANNKEPIWDNWPSVVKVRNKIKDTPVLRKNVVIAGELSDSGYATAIKFSRFLLNANLYDNGCLGTIDAAWLGVPCVAGRYPAQEYFDESFHLNGILFDPHDSSSLAQAIRIAEDTRDKIVLPDRSFLNTFDWKNQAVDFYDIFSTYLEARQTSECT